jgi:hypothetical protein
MTGVSEMSGEKISVEVAYALAERQQIIALDVEEGATAYEAAVQSGIVKSFPEIDLDSAGMGVFGKSVKPKIHKMAAGERVEIYRPLIADPKEARKKRADKVKARKSEA